MAAKTGIKKKGASLSIPPEKRWTVVDQNNWPVYLESESGITQEEAKRLSGLLQIQTRVVPRGALDQGGRFDESLLEKATEIALAEDE
jgi:hypothetical protein